jgi:carnosine N-methyltransferase
VCDYVLQGANERKQCYDPLVQELKRLKPTASDATSDQLVRVLVPGAGMARLAFDIAHAGYACTGNEFSFFMLHASNWILNRSTR